MKLSKNLALATLLTWGGVATVYGCGGSQPAADNAPPPAASSAAPAADSAAPEQASPEAAPAMASASAAAAAAPPPEAAPPPVEWDKLNRDQRMELMKTKVMPRMKELFSEFDAKKYGDMKCPTCHGDGAKNQTFKMPNPKLPKLSYTDGFKKHKDKTPEMTKFMMEKVVPEMAKLIGEEVYNPQTQKGFGCGECHQMGK